MSSILREWRGVIRKIHRQEYVDYIQGTGLDDYRATPGNQGAAIAVRDLDQERTEIVIYGRRQHRYGGGTSFT